MSRRRKVVYISVIGFIALFCIGFIFWYFIKTIQYHVDKNREAVVIQKTVLMFTSSVLSEIEKNGTSRAIIALNNLLDMSIVGAWNNKFYLNKSEEQEIQSYISRAIEYRKMEPRAYSNEKSLSSIQIQADNIMSNINGELGSHPEGIGTKSKFSTNEF